MKIGSPVGVALVASMMALAAPISRAQDQPPTPATAPAGDGAAALAKQLSNPVASLVSVPFQMNWDQGVGVEKDTRFLLNFQPVLPFSLNKDWNLIARVITPILSQPALVPGGQPTFGFSDLLVSAFFSPAQPKGVVCGVGPALQLPASADPYLGSEKWAAGPTLLVLKQAGH